jgi:hypothetical protein
MPIQIRPGNSALVKFGHGDVLIDFHPARKVSSLRFRPGKREYRIGEFTADGPANGLSVKLSFDGPAAIDCVIDALDVLRRQMRAGVKTARAANKELINQSPLSDEEKQRLLSEPEGESDEGAA